ncbi:unnamed protein product [Arctogadus glacialis]
MTVDHLKTAPRCWGKGYFEAHVFSKDYRSLGFRECWRRRRATSASWRAGTAATPSGAPGVSPQQLWLSEGDPQRARIHGWSPAHRAHPLLLQHPQARMPPSRNSTTSRSRAKPYRPWGLEIGAF